MNLINTTGPTCETGVLLYKSSYIFMKYTHRAVVLLLEIQKDSENSRLRMLPSGLAIVCLLLLQSGALGFIPTSFFAGNSIHHMAITESALLNITLQVCKDLASVEGVDFTPPSGLLSAANVAAACFATNSEKSFVNAIKDVRLNNAKVDLLRYFNGEYHFTDEKFIESRKIITDGLSVVKASVKTGNFDAARQTLGAILHTLQDFYSHSNWIELGNTLPNSIILITDPKQSIGKTADKGRATCRDCVGNDCHNNILEDVLNEGILTSAYFGPSRFHTKPAGKCSHGGVGDFTSTIQPTGGINKDTLDSSHGSLHLQAAAVAVAATRELLEDIRGASGDADFLRLMGISRVSKALCFVIDTTGSMSDDIAAVKSFTTSLVDSRRGTPEEPSLYILVPFNDPEFGPLIRTTDPDFFKNQINALSASGGGDFPELSLSGLQLALTGSPPGSDIFLFTDATAKDTYLLGAVRALLERTKSEVTFMLTGILARDRRRKRLCNNGQLSRMLVSDTDLYKELAQSSGGQAIQVTKTQLPDATTIITDASNPLQITLLQAVSSPGNADNFSFLFDQSVNNLTVYITGRSLSFSVTSPSGASQSNLELHGTLGTIQTVGNFLTLRLNKEVGTWEISMTSTQPYTVKVIGQSALDFLFDFVELFQSAHSGFAVLGSRPTSGGNGTMLVTVTGSDSVNVTEVALVETSGSGEIIGSVEPLGGRDFLVHLDRIPQGNFVVRLRGEATSITSSRAAAGIFQRLSSTSLRASSITLTANSNGVLEPGIPFSVPFTVATSGTGGTFTIRASNDRGFASSSPSSLLLISGGVANGTVTLTAPAGTASGSDVTLTIEAEAPGATDTNYAVLRLSFVVPVTDIIRPVCQVLAVSANCSADCSLTTWQLSANLTDGNGTGIESLTLRQGNGTLNTSTVVGAEGYNVTLVSYSASCCSPDVELVAVDRVGNVGSCFSTIRSAVDTITTQAPNSTQTNPSTQTQTTSSLGNSVTSTLAVATTSRGHPGALSSYLHLSTGLLAFSLLLGIQAEDVV